MNNPGGLSSSTTPHPCLCLHRGRIEKELRLLLAPRGDVVPLIVPKTPCLVHAQVEPRLRVTPTPRMVLSYPICVYTQGWLPPVAQPLHTAIHSTTFHEA